MNEYKKQFYLRNSTSAYWYSKSHDLIVSAHALWVAMQESRKLEVNCLATYKMLVGMSFELIFKAHCISSKTDFIQSHKLYDLALTAGISVSEQDKSILDILTEYIIWDGRYPTPKRFQYLRDHWRRQGEVLTNEVGMGCFKFRQSNGKLDFDNLIPIWRRFSDAYLDRYN